MLEYVVHGIRDKWQSLLKCSAIIIAFVAMEVLGVEIM
jgi:hypothetical protein